MVPLPARWSGSIWVNAWWNRWRDVIAVSAAISSRDIFWAHCSLTRCSFVCQIIYSLGYRNNVYNGAYMYVLSFLFYQSCMPFLCHLLFNPSNETYSFNTGYILTFTYIVLLLIDVLVKNDDIKMFNQIILTQDNLPKIDCITILYKCNISSWWDLWLA